MSDQAAGGSGGSNQPPSLQDGGGVAAAAGVPAGQQLQPESPPFIGLISSGSAERPWWCQARMGSKIRKLAGCVTRAQAD
jgi:hypothetical protein